MLWHMVNEDAVAVAEIDKRGWWPKRPSFLASGALNLENAAGEDFLYMHRRMIRMLHEVYAGAGATAPSGWTDLPAAAVPQTVYREATVAGTKRFVFDASASGFMVPPPARDGGDRLVKSPTTGPPPMPAGSPRPPSTVCHGSPSMVTWCRWTIRSPGRHPAGTPITITAGRGPVTPTCG
jgi:hypothetical protein